MFIVRPAEASDIPGLLSLASGVIRGVHTMARTKRSIESAVELSLRSFASPVDIPGEEAYLFVLENTATTELAGSAAIAATAGSNGTFFSFRNDVIQQVSRDLNISHSVHALTLCADLTSYSQLRSFFVRRDHHAGSDASLLSRARLMFASLRPQRFSDHFFVSLAGYTDHKGHSPFWDALGRHFFKVDFLDAECMVQGARNRSLIIELMPHYPVYVPLLPGTAQAAMGQVHEESQVPFDILSREGFAADEFIDIFDGGPILQANKNALNAFARSLKLEASIRNADPHPTCQSYLVTATNSLRTILVKSEPLLLNGTVMLKPEQIEALQACPGESMLCALT